MKMKPFKYVTHPFVEWPSGYQQTIPSNLRTCIVFYFFRCLTSQQWNIQVNCLSLQRALHTVPEAFPLLRTHPVLFIGQILVEATRLAQFLHEQLAGVMMM